MPARRRLPGEGARPGTEPGRPDFRRVHLRFRQTFGGLHMLSASSPTWPMFGKALGNGYAIAAVIGRREVMEAAQATSSAAPSGPSGSARRQRSRRCEPMARWPGRRRRGSTRSAAGALSAGSRRLQDAGLTLNLGELPVLATYTGRRPRSVLVRTLASRCRLVPLGSGDHGGGALLLGRGAASAAGAATAITRAPVTSAARIEEVWRRVCTAGPLDGRLARGNFSVTGRA